MVERGELEMGHARAMLTLQGEQQSQVAKTIFEKEMTIRNAESYIRKLQEPVKDKKQGSRPDPDITQLQNTLCDTLRASVIIDHSKNGKGRLIIKYNSLDELRGLVNKLGKA